MSNKFKLNKKCFSVMRALNEAESKWDYIHVSQKGVIATDKASLIRITLPEGEQPQVAQIFPSANFRQLAPKNEKQMVEMPEGEPAQTSGKFTVPNHEHTIPDPNKQTATLTVNAEYLIKLLKAAVEVTEHTKALVRLRFYGNCIRIDAHRGKGEQEFLGLLMGTSYNGTCIPGDVGTGKETATPTSESNDQKHLVLPVHEGRKFRE